ncbi:MAG: iron ABC transporter permease [Alphaproteobacteria bacterium]|nr:iron ABC transporter permease [Alphaproteobacteria bacterium]
MPAKGFASPRPGVELNFPDDHGAHREYRIEWWYLTANLEDSQGRPLGAQWTLFRTALAPGEGGGWSDPQLYMGHAALTSSTDHVFAERLGRGGTGQAGVWVSPFHAFIDDWSMKSLATSDADPLSHLELFAAGSDFSYRLTARAGRPLILHGDRGYSLKSASGQASYYYSQPFYEVTGEIELKGQRTRVSGQAWLDREWSSQPLAADQTGWDWFSLHFDNGEKLMGFSVRDSAKGFSSGTWISRDGRGIPLSRNSLKAFPLAYTRVEGRRIPTRWRIVLEERGVDVTLRAINPNAFMKTSAPYWEGPVTFSGTHSGRGYLEMTGYE